MNSKKNDIGFTKTKLPYGWLGNLSRFQVIYDGKTWGSTEHLFQAMRFVDDEIKEQIRKENGPYQSKQKAKEFVDEMSIEMLSEKDISNMKLCITLKIQQNNKLRDELLATEDRQIIEDVTKRGDIGSNLFWGAMLVDGKWIGKSVLGNLWMDLRTELRNKSIL